MAIKHLQPYSNNLCMAAATEAQSARTMPTGYLVFPQDTAVADDTNAVAHDTHALC